MVRIVAGSVSITGNYRENNEDRCLVDSDGRYFLVADGMGGQSAGEKASQLAVELISRQLSQLVDFQRDRGPKVVKSIDAAVHHANAEIMALGELEPTCHNMGTTIVFALAASDKLYVGGVGDSRAYLFRKGKLEQLTVDHSLTQALLDAGTITPEEATTHRYRNVLYRYLGTREGGTGTSAKELAPEKGDRVVLCSDGVTDGLKDEALVRLLQEHPDPQSAAQAIVDAALQGGSRDNITCVVLNVE
jgi:protein phosphatase